MAGVEVLAGIGILCNAMQIVTFGKDALEVYNHLRENGTADPRLESYLADASMSYQEMRKQLSTFGSLTSDQQEIVRIGKDAHDGLEEFRTYFARLYVDKNSRKGLRGRLRVAKSGVKALFRAKELEDLEKNFQRYQQLFQARLIQRVCSQRDAAALLTQECFTSLNSTQQSMVRRIADGHTDMSLLVSRKAVEMKDHVTNQHEKTRIALRSHLSITENNLHSHVSESTSVLQHNIASRNNNEDEMKRYDQLMASLRYPEMNIRKNQVIENFPKTFQWIFSNEGLWDEDVSPQESYDYKEESPNEEHVGDRFSRAGNDHSDKGSSEERNIAPASKRSDEGGTSREDYHDSIALTASCADNSTEFTRWLGSESKMFWISGKPGSGKSTLMKFIAANPATQSHMAAWRSDVHILTHFFWKAGSPMERSLKGLLLSLTYQVLLGQIPLAKRLRDAVPEVCHKWSHGDWDLQELKTVLLWVLSAAEEAFFLLIDGLDESEEIGIHLSMTPSNLSILDNLVQLRDVKICVSSREEYIFNRHFEGTERLRIHELTDYDIRQFANSRLEMTKSIGPEERGYIINLIATTADGVFLWVALVLNSVIRAFRLDNNIRSLVERIERMPRDLIHLVQDMWERSGEDGDVPSYRASASRYFNLALARNGRDIQDESILTMALALEERGLEFMLEVYPIWDVAELERICARTEKQISVVCHGLLEFECFQLRSDIPLPESLERWSRITTRFAHRCVIDFLQDTESGSSLLGACEWRQGEARARLVGARMLQHRLITPDSVDLSSLRYYSKVINKKRYILPSLKRACVEYILGETTICTIGASDRQFLFRKCCEWFLDGLPYDHALWKLPIGSIPPESSLRNELLASMADAANLPIMERLVRSFPREDFLSALPPIYRGLSKRFRYERLYSPWYRSSETGLRTAHLTKQILSRLLALREDKDKRDGLLKASTGESPEVLQRLVCSWYLGTLPSLADRPYDTEARNVFPEILHLIKLALPQLSDWTQCVLLGLWRRKDGSLAMRGSVVSDGLQWLYKLFVVVNLATAYQIVLDSIQHTVAALQSTHGYLTTDKNLPQIPDGVPLFLRIVAIKDGDSLSDWHTFNEEAQYQASKLVLHSILTSQGPTSEEWAIIKNGKGNQIGINESDYLEYLISELGHIPGLPMHPWSTWLVGDASRNEEDEDSLDQVDERSQQSFRDLVKQISGLLNDE